MQSVATAVQSHFSTKVKDMSSYLNLEQTVLNLIDCMQEVLNETNKNTDTYWFMYESIKKAKEDLNYHAILMQP